MNYEDLIQALAKDYLNVYIVNCVNNTGSIVKLNGYIIDGIIDAPKQFNYDNMLIKYAKSRVYKDDLNDFMALLSNSSLLNIFLTNHNNEYEFNYRILDENNSIHYYSAYYVKISKENEPLELVVGYRNIDNLIEFKEEAKNEGLYKAYNVLANVYMSMYRIDVINKKYYEIKTTKYIKRDVVDSEGQWFENIQNVVEDLCSVPFRKSLLEFLDINTFEERLKDRDQLIFEFVAKYSGWCRGRIIKGDLDENGRLFHVIWAIEVIELDKQREEALKKAAYTDLLTGIYNRGYGEICVNNLLKENNGGTFTLFDIDDFKSINDTYGHDVGDKIIIEIANAIEKASHEEDIVFRLGGDEFAVYSPGIFSREEVKIIYENFVVRVKNMKIKEVDRPITISIGTTFVNKDKKETFSTLYKRADTAMYESKKEEGFKITILD